VKISTYRLCKNISQVRQKRGISVKELAQRIDESVECVMQIEEGRKYMTLAMLMSICQALNVTPDVLLDDVMV